MSLISPYLALFLPLITSIFCFLLNFKKSNSLVFISAIFLLLILLLKLSFDFAIKGEIVGDSGLGVLSIATEYRFDFLAIFFLLLVLLLKMLMAFFYKTNVSKSLKDNNQAFYASWLLNIFAIIGIFTTNNIFNLFIFVEIYCLSFSAIMAISSDVNLSKLAFEYFCRSVLASILFLFALVLIYSQCESLHFTEIGNLLLKENSTAKFWQISLLIVISIWLKFFPISLYQKIFKSQDLLANFLLVFSFIINGLVGFYIVFRMICLFNFNQMIVNFLIIMGVFLVFYGNYRMLKIKHLKVFALNFMLVNLGFVMITFFVDHSFFTTLFYVANYAIAGLAVFILSKYVGENYQTCNFKLLENLALNNSINKNFFLKKNIALTFLILLIVTFPITLTFWANWQLSLLVFNFDFSAIILLPIITTNLVLTYLGSELMFQKSFRD